MRKLSLFLFLIFCLIGVMNAEESSIKAKKDSDEPQSATASKPPPPEKESCRAIEMIEKKSTLAGKIVKIKFNRIAFIRKFEKEHYTGNLRSRETSSGTLYSSHPGIEVLFPHEGLGYFTKFIPDFGYAQNDVSDLIKPDLGEVYVWVGHNNKEASMAVGDRYEQDGDEGKYTWSTDTKVPDLTAKSKVTVGDLLLYPDQLNGKTVVVEFYRVVASQNNPVGESPLHISSGSGHSYVQISFPPEGKVFFKGIADQQAFAKAATVYAVVNVASDGTVTLEAKGRRVSGSGDDATYKW